MSPFYDYECDDCKIVEEYFHHMKEMNGTVKHKCTCGKDMKRMYIFNHPKEFWSYNDPTLGYVTSRADKRKKMKKMGLTNYEPTAFKGKPGTPERERYNKFADGIEKTKDYYKHKDIKHHDVQT